MLDILDLSRKKGDRLSYTGLKWRGTKQLLLFRLGLAKLGIHVHFVLLFHGH